MESTAADAMPDDTDLTPQAPEPEQAPAETSGDTSAEPANATGAEPATPEAKTPAGTRVFIDSVQYREENVPKSCKYRAYG